MWVTGYSESRMKSSSLKINSRLYNARQPRRRIERYPVARTGRGTID